MNKLSKKTIENMITPNEHAYEPICQGCHTPLNPSNMKIGVEKLLVRVCLHSGALFCRAEQCQAGHEKDTHLFSLDLSLQDRPPSLLGS
jgi:hypothetical protein